MSIERQSGVIGLVQEALIEEYAPAAIAIDQNYDILYHNGPTNQYLRQPRGVPTRNLLELLPGQLANRIRSALYRAASEEKPISIRASVPAEDDKKRQVTLRLTKLGDNLYLVVFRSKAEAGPEAETYLSESPSVVEEAAVRQLETELATTRADLQTHIEQLKSLNEELQSSNEEMQAANEELETSREELQSLNEELITVNSQLQEKVEEQDATNNDLNNFLASTNIPTVFLDLQFKVKRFTPAMLKLIKLLTSDVGRPIADMSQENLGPDLITAAQSVLESLTPARQELPINGEWYVRATLPYRTADNRIEGVVVTYNDVTELKRAEERTRHLASFPQLNPNPVIEVDAAGTIIFANPGAERILECLGMDRADASVFLPKDFNAILRDLGSTEELTASREVTIKDRVFDVSIQLIPQFHVARIYAYDVTKRKRAEEALRESEKKYRSLFDNMINGFALHKIVVDDAGKPIDYIFLEVNSAFERLTGLKAGNIVNKNVTQALPGIEKDPADWIGAYGKVALTGEVLRFEQYAQALGKWYAVMAYSPGRNYFATVFEDITERKRAEEALRESEDRLKRAQQISHLGSWELDLVNNRLTWSDEVYRIFGLQPQEFGATYEAFLEAVHPDDRVAVDAAYSGSIRDGRDTYEIEHRVVRKNTGELRSIHEKCEHFRDESGKIIRSVGMVHDITERKKAEEEIKKNLEELQTANAELARFNAAAVGRELRMIELKREINELCDKAGAGPRYPLEFEKEA